MAQPEYIQKLTGLAVRINCCDEFHNLDAMDLNDAEFYSCSVCERPLIIRGNDGKVYMMNDKPMF